MCVYLQWRCSTASGCKDLVWPHTSCGQRLDRRLGFGGFRRRRDRLCRRGLLLLGFADTGGQFVSQRGFHFCNNSSMIEVISAAADSPRLPMQNTLAPSSAEVR